jgi:hypothetical protein
VTLPGGVRVISDYSADGAIPAHVDRALWTIPVGTIVVFQACDPAPVKDHKWYEVAPESYLVEYPPHPGRKEPRFEIIHRSALKLQSELGGLSRVRGLAEKKAEEKAQAEAERKEQVQQAAALILRIQSHGNRHYRGPKEVNSSASTASGQAQGQRQGLGRGSTGSTGRGGAQARPASAQQTYGRATLAGYNPVTYAQDVLRETLTSAYPSHGPDGQRIAPFPGDVDYSQDQDQQQRQYQSQYQYEPTPMFASPPAQSFNKQGQQQDRVSPQGSTGSSHSKLSGGPRRVRIGSAQAAPKYDVGVDQVQGAEWAQGQEEEGEEGGREEGQGMPLTPSDSGSSSPAQGHSYRYGQEQSLMGSPSNPLSRSRQAEIEGQLQGIQATLRTLEARGLAGQ